MSCVYSTHVHDRRDCRRSGRGRGSLTIHFHADTDWAVSALTTLANTVNVHIYIYIYVYAILSTLQNLSISLTSHLHLPLLFGVCECAGCRHVMQLCDVCAWIAKKRPSRSIRSYRFVALSVHCVISAQLVANAPVIQIVIVVINKLINTEAPHCFQPIVVQSNKNTEEDEKQTPGEE